MALKPVAQAARKLKLATTDGEDWTVLWSHKPPWDIDSLAKRRVAGAGPYLVNHLPGTTRLVSKVDLVQFSAGLAARLPRIFGAITPETYALPEQARLLDAAIARRGLSDAYGWPNWLAKSKQHRGIHVVSGNASHTMSELGETLVQERVRPLLLPGLPRVFDVGLYVLVSSVRPLHVWAFNRSLVRVCLSSYPRETRKKGWARAAFAESRRYVIKEYTPFWRLRAFAPHLKRCAGEAGCAMRAALDEAGYDGGALWRRMERIAASLLVALRPSVEAALARRRMRGASAFELFRFDFLVDEDAQPVLTEVNLSPNLATAPGAPEDGAVKETLLVETLRLVTQRFAPAPNATPAATPTATPAAAPLAVPTGDGSLESLGSVPGSVPADLRGVTCGGSCCRLQAACNSSWARLTRSHCLSRAELQMLHLAAAEQRVAVAGGMQRIWPARLGTGNVRTLWPVPPREDRLLACWTRAAS